MDHSQLMTPQPMLVLPEQNMLGEVGLSERVVYDSITPHVKEEEITAIRDAKIKSAILLTLNTKNPTISGRLQVLVELLATAQTAQKAGIEKFLVILRFSTCQIRDQLARPSTWLRKKYGLPAGAGTHNAVDRWKSRRKLDATEYMLATSVANVFPINCRSQLHIVWTH